MVEHDGYELPTGWLDRPADVETACQAMTAAGHELELARAAPFLFEQDENGSVFLWDAEQAILGRILPCWNQNPVGSCVGFGFTRGVQDVLLNEIASGEAERWPGSELAPEVVYIGSRVEANGGRSPIQPSRRDPDADGSVGAWAAKFLTEWGVVARGRYGSVDLTKYDPKWVRANQFKGLPDDIEAAARLHPITTAALVRSAADVWAALGARKAVAFCSRLGFEMSIDRDGFVIPSRKGWGHCWLWRARFNHPRRGRCYVGQNSWRNPDGSVTWPTQGRVSVETTDRGTVLLPEGCAAMTEDIVEAICRERDSFSLAGLSGWKRLELTMDPYA
jgi:hypothetical protein